MMGSVVSFTTAILTMLLSLLLLCSPACTFSWKPPLSSRTSTSLSPPWIVRIDQMSTTSTALFSSERTEDTTRKIIDKSDDDWRKECRDYWDHDNWRDYRSPSRRMDDVETIALPLVAIFVAYMVFVAIIL
jgi:hypothetical protein